MRRLRRFGFNLIKEGFDQLPTAICFLTAEEVLFFATDRCIV